MSFLVRPGEGHHLGGSFDVLVRVRSEQTAGVMAVIEETLAPGAFITPHTHRNDVWVHVLAGEVGVLVGEETAQAQAGAWALKPRNVLHAMWNAGAEPARIIEVLTPAGTERWFEEIAELPPGDEAGFRDACDRHGIAFYPDSPWTATLRERHGLLPSRQPGWRGHRDWRGSRHPPERGGRAYAERGAAPVEPFAPGSRGPSPFRSLIPGAPPAT